MSDGMRDSSGSDWFTRGGHSPQAEAQREGGQWTEREREALDELMKLTDLSEHGVLRQGLRVYQLIVKGSHVLTSPPSGEPGPPPIIGPDGDHHTQEWFDGYEEARMHFELPVPRASDESGERLPEPQCNCPKDAHTLRAVGRNLSCPVHYPTKKATPAPSEGPRDSAETFPEPNRAFETLKSPSGTPSEGNESARELSEEIKRYVEHEAGCDYMRGAPEEGCSCGAWAFKQKVRALAERGKGERK